MKGNTKIVFPILLLVVVTACSAVGTTSAPTPTTDDAYVTLSLKKITNPAFADEVAGKWIRCNVLFRGVDPHIMTLPKEYQTGYVKFLIKNPEDRFDRATLAADVVMPKAKSDLIFELNNYEPIELFAYLAPIETYSHIPGRKQPGVIFVVEKVLRISDH